MGQDAYDEGKWDEAAASFKRAVSEEKAGNAKGAKYNLALAYERAGRWAEAAEAYAVALELDTTRKDIQLRYGRSLSKSGNSAKAVKVLNRQLEGTPEDAELLNELTYALRMAKKYDAAAATARKVVLRDQENLGALNNLARIYREQGKLFLSQRFFFLVRSKLRGNKDLTKEELARLDSQVDVELGLLARLQGEELNALVFFEEAVNRDPKNAIAHQNVGAITMKFLDYRRAVTSYDAALNTGTTPTCELLTGLVYARKGLDTDRGYDRDPETFELREAQEPEKSLSVIERAMAICPPTPELVYAKAEVCFLHKKDNECAMTNYKLFVSQSGNLPEDHLVHQRMSTLQMMMNPAPAEELAPEEPSIEPAAEGGEAPVASEQQPEASDAAETAASDDAPQSVASTDGGSSKS
jgi:tetratricopeptide (TPR) repeat protein